MHEYSIAWKIMKRVLEECDFHGFKKVKALHLRVGEMTMLAPEQLDFALRSLAMGTIAEKMKIKIDVVPLRVKCGGGHETSLNKMQPTLGSAMAIPCPVCGAPTKMSPLQECVIKEMDAD